MIHPLASHFQMLAHYNQLANQRLYHACAQLDDQALKQPRPAFFHSIHGTLNHILVGDRIWMGRFAGQVLPAIGLDAILYESFADLWQARQFQDQAILTFMDHLTPEFLEQILEYRNRAGNVHCDPVPLLLTHFFNHQTHHRGQVHNLLSQTSIVPPSLDLHRVLK